MLVKTGMILLIALALLMNDRAEASEVGECIDKCQRALQAQDKYIIDLDNIRTLQGSLINHQNNKIARLEDEATRWYRNPVVIFFTGLSVGIMLNQQARK